MPSSSSRRSPLRVAAELAEVHGRHPSRTQLLELGQTHSGRPILGLLIGDALQPSDPRPVILLDGAHHGGELPSVDIVLDAIAVLLDSPPASLAPRVERWLRELICAMGSCDRIRSRRSRPRKSDLAHEETHHA